MEQGEGSHHDLRLPKSCYDLTPALDAGNSKNRRRERPIPANVRDQDRFMPIANVSRIMRRVLPPRSKISDEAKETIQQCVSEFIGIVTAEANGRCHREQRKTVSAEDLIWGISKLGLDDYVEPLTVFLNRYREMDIGRREPFARRTVDFGLAEPENYGSQAPPEGPAPQGIFDAQAVMMMNGTSGYQGDNGGVGSAGGSSSSQASLPGFDPYEQFKQTF